jgi:hypothetical protein
LLFLIFCPTAVYTVNEQQISVQNRERHRGRIEGKHPMTGLGGHSLLTSIPERRWPYLILGQ